MGGTAFEQSVLDTIRIGARLTMHDPWFVIRGARLLWRQRSAAQRRRRQKAAGVRVPPFLIFSITERCNFRCAGCYANLLHRSERPELTAEKVEAILGEARDLGVSVILIAGGEPFLRPRLLDLTASVPEILFLLFTNASRLDRSAIERLCRQPHVIPILSIEGDEQRTDARRGVGTHARVLDAMERLRRAHAFFGTAMTLTSENFDTATDRQHLEDLQVRGCRLFYYINYVPVEPGTDALQLSVHQVEELERRLEAYRRSMPALFIAFPHDEAAFGGCLAAGRGFLHINAFGDVEPCPFSPYSDSNLNEMPLRDALGSPLFRRILESGVDLNERDGRCALWKRREWVLGLLESEEESGSP